jgi:hypothetical protein
MPVSDAERPALIREQITRLLDSPGFAGRERLSRFFRYVCNAALDGRSEIEQVELAEAVLGRTDDFNPVEDASVRKLATTTRHRLAEYYSGPGQHDPVIISLPQRSYLPRFRFVDPAAEPAPHPPTSPRAVPRLAMYGAVGIFALAATTFAVYSWYRPRPLAGRFTLHVNKPLAPSSTWALPPESLLLGPQIGPNEQAVARMTFSPGLDGDQAGLVILDDTSHYVKLARSLARHNTLWFTGLARVQDPVEDPDGQTGAPIWLAIRRNGTRFRAFTSLDGQNWRPVGEPVEAALSLDKARIGLFALRRANSAQALTATFDRLSIGVPLANWGDPAPLPSAWAGWEELNECKDQTTLQPASDRLALSFTDMPLRCRWSLVRPVPDADWSMRVLVESVAWARSFAGITLRGQGKQRFYVLRNSIDGGTIGATGLDAELFRRPDYPGSPPLAIHLYRQGRFLHAEVGTSWETLEPTPMNYDLQPFGSQLRVGPSGGRGSRQPNLAVDPIGFRFAAMDVLSLTPLH